MPPSGSSDSTVALELHLKSITDAIAQNKVYREYYNFSHIFSCTELGAVQPWDWAVSSELFSAMVLVTALTSLGVPLVLRPLLRNTYRSGVGSEP